MYALSAFSVESIYYHPEIQRRLAEKQSEILESDAETLLLKAKNEAISSIAQQKGHLCRRIAEKLVREQIFQNLPTRGDIGEKPSIEISINIVELVAEEERKLQELLDSESLHEIIEKYPIRETGAMNAISKALGFQGAKQYQGAVRKILISNEEALTFVQGLFGELKPNLH